MSAQSSISRTKELARLAVRINADYAARHAHDKPPTRPPIEMSEYKCLRCGYEWRYYADKPKPRTCPACHSRLWEHPKPHPTPRISDISRVCMVCGHTWSARKKARPCACPHCHSPNWDKEPIINNCAKCGHTWEGRKTTPYLSCPFCHSRKWQENTDSAQIKATNKT